MTMKNVERTLSADVVGEGSETGQVMDAHSPTHGQRIRGDATERLQLLDETLFRAVRRPDDVDIVPALRKPRGEIQYMPPRAATGGFEYQKDSHRSSDAVP